MMPAEPDTIVSPRRPAFREGQVLGAGDLRADDQERVQAERRHSQRLHGAGVVAGLWVNLGPDSSFVAVSPGMAIDGLGRTILVGQSQTARLPDHSAETEREYELWIAHFETPSDGESDTVPTAAPARYAETTRLIFEEPGQYDPANPSTHPDRAVFLGLILKGSYPEDESAAFLGPAGETAHAAGGPNLRSNTAPTLPARPPRSNRVRDEGRVYVGAVGARVQTPRATAGARLLLGPEGANDRRLFAIGSRPQPSAPWDDHLLVDSSRSIQILSPMHVDRYRADKTKLALVEVGVRSNAFQGEDLLDSHGLASALLAGPRPVELYLRRRYLRSGDAANLPTSEALWLAAALASNDPQSSTWVDSALCQLLNRVIEFEARELTLNPGSDFNLVDVVIDAGLNLRKETARLLDEARLGTPRFDPERTVRLLLEDVFPSFVRRLAVPENRDGPQGLSFLAGKPVSPLPQPGRFYLATVTEKGVTRQELRLELFNPGKENNPERYRLAVGTIGPKSTPSATTTAKETPAAAFEPLLGVDSGGKVTIFKDLNVFNTFEESRLENPEPGLILSVKPKDGDDLSPGGALPAIVGHVAPWDLELKEISGVRTPDKKGIILKGRLHNKNKDVTVEAIQILAKASCATDASIEPVSETLCRGARVEGDKSIELDSLDPGTQPADRIVLRIPEKLGNSEITLIITAIGLAPPNVLLNVERRIII